MLRALENQGPQVIVVDEIGTLDEARAARTIGERGVQLVAGPFLNIVFHLRCLT